MPKDVEQNSERVLAYLGSIYPRGTGSHEIASALRLSTPLAAARAARQLIKEGKIRAERIKTRKGVVWMYYAFHAVMVQPAEVNPAHIAAGDVAEPGAEAVVAISPAQSRFKHLARSALSALYACELAPKAPHGPPRIYDLVSEDGSFVGESVYFEPSEVARVAPERFSLLAERVWLLEKAQAKNRFLVTGGDRRPLSEWVRCYGKFAGEIAFYYLDVQGRLEKIEC